MSSYVILVLTIASRKGDHAIWRNLDFIRHTSSLLHAMITVYHSCYSQSQRRPTHHNIRWFALDACWFLIFLFPLDATIRWFFLNRGTWCLVNSWFQHRQDFVTVVGNSWGFFPWEGWFLLDVQFHPYLGEHLHFDSRLIFYLAWNHQLVSLSIRQLEGIE